MVSTATGRSTFEPQASPPASSGGSGRAYLILALGTVTSALEPYTRFAARILRDRLLPAVSRLAHACECIASAQLYAFAEMADCMLPALQSRKMLRKLESLAIPRGGRGI